MTSTKLAALAIVLSCIALLYSFLNAPAAVNATEEGLSISSATPYQTQAMADMDRRMTLLERRIEELKLPLASTPSTQRQTAGEPTEETPDLVSRMEDLEKALQDVKATQSFTAQGNGRMESAQLMEDRMASELAKREEKMETLRDMVSTWTTKALDPSLTESDRVAALGGLRGNHLADGTDARTPVISDMILMAQSSDSARIRADVWRQMDGIKDPALKSALLHALANDNSADVREEAAESLGAFLPDSAVETALRNAKDFDADQGVREQAEESLTNL